MEQQRDQREVPAQQPAVGTPTDLAERAEASDMAPTQVQAVPASASADEILPVTDTQGLVRELAGRLGEESGQIVVHRDLSTLLDRMRDGVVVQLSISRPRFFKKLSLEDLGLKVNLDLATSEEALRVITDYFHLGRRSLLPREWQDRLANVENNARYCLKKHSLKSHWGAFIPIRDKANSSPRVMPLR